MYSFAGIILAGGQSKRIGSDKALLPYHEKPLIEYSIDLLKGFCDTLLISANRHELERYGYKVVEDKYPKIGPIGGLYSTLQVSDHDHNLVCPCDMPHIEPVIIDKIIAAINGHSAVVVKEKNGKVNPLLGYYHCSCLPTLKKQIDRGIFTMQAAMAELKACEIIIDDQHSLLNINYLKDMK